VAELVAAENRENRSAVPEAGQQQVAQHERHLTCAKVGDKPVIVVGAGKRCRPDRKEEEQGVPPHTVLELRTGLPQEFRWRKEAGIVANGPYPIFCRSLPGLK